ncbi:MAG TPA: hypothetical protein VHM01_15805 [Alphaproteobacteria bacterium]|nr:hypothetical protein [Alphaproteobacteria bacterium]
MRILPLAMIGLAVLAAGCAGRDTQRSAATSTQQSGAMATTANPVQGDAIDRYAAAYEQQRGRRF